MTSRRDLLTTVDEYDGREGVLIAATQLGLDYTPSQARRIVADWVDFLSGGPTPIRRLAFVSRTPARLFAALEGQTQLESLSVKWGDYADLSPLGGMAGLRELALRGASRVADVAPLARLNSLRALVIEGFREIADPSPLGRLHGLTALELGGDWISPRNGHLSSIGFLRELDNLEELLLHTVIVDDKDYAPLLELPRLRRVRVKAVRGMHPPIDLLKSRLPWDG